jgi:nucleotide-binding universal stress UspA family protein
LLFGYCFQEPSVARSRILVAVSSPWASEKLCSTIRDLAERLNGSVVVAHVAQPNDDDESEDDVRQRGEQTLSTLTTRLVEAGLTAEGVLLFGDDVARAILNAAEAHDATLIILGASGKGRMARLLAGDVPQQVTRQARLPVLLFPPDWSGMV